MLTCSSHHLKINGRLSRIFPVLGIVLLLSLMAGPGAGNAVWAAAPGQDSYPGPAETVEAVAEPEATIAPADYPGPAQEIVPVESAATVVPTDYPEPAQPTTGPAESGASGSESAPAIATPVPLPPVPEDQGGSRVSLLLVGLVLLGLVIVVVLIVMRRR